MMIAFLSFVAAFIHQFNYDFAPLIEFNDNNYHGLLWFLGRIGTCIFAAGIREGGGRVNL